MSHLKEIAAGGERQVLELPSQRQLADLLDIPRERLPGLFATLQKLAHACQRRGFERGRM